MPAPTVPSSPGRWLSAYYVVNATLLAALPAACYWFRTATPEGSTHSSVHSVAALAAWERQAMTAYASVVGFQVFRRRSWDHWAQQVFFYGKVVAALTLYQVDIRLLPWFLAAWWAVAAVAPQPMCTLTSDEDDAITELTPPRLRDLVMGGSNDSTWLVFLYATNHDQSTAMAPAFVSLARRYRGSRIRFAAMDALLWPNVSKDQLKLVPSTWVAQLPAVLLFHKGREAGRLPVQGDVDDIGLKRNHFTAADVVKKLNLARYAGSSSQAQSVGGQQQQQQQAGNSR